MIDELICMLFGYKLLQLIFNFLLFIREPGQNVRCHKFGGPCAYVSTHTYYMPSTIILDLMPSLNARHPHRQQSSI